MPLAEIIAAAAHAAPANGTIVIVDDAPEVLRVAEVSLRRAGGYTVYSADNAESGLALLHTHHPQLLLLDVMMPHTSGPELLIRMRADASLASTAVMFMSAFCNPQQIAVLKATGAVGVIAKPFRPLQLVERVRTYLEKLDA